MVTEMQRYLPTASEGWGKVMFSVFSQGRGEGYLTPLPSPGQDGGGGISRYLPPSQGTYPPVQVRRGGTPKYLPPWPRYLPPVQVRMQGGGTPRYLPPSQPRYPPPQDKPAHGVLDKRWSVCLLCSRRTFLSHLFLHECYYLKA